MLCLTLFLASGTPALALTLGELTVQSAVGQRFRGSVSYQLAPEDNPAEYCSKLSILAAGNDLPGIGQASVRLQPGERGGRILIQSAEAIFEPVTSFNLRMDCKGQQLQRSYTVFLDPAPISPPAVAEETLPTRPAAQTRAPVARHQDTPAVKQATPLRSKPKKAITPITPPPAPVAESLPATGGQLRIESELSSKNIAPAVLSPEDLQTKIAMMQSLQEQLQSEMIRLDRAMQNLQGLNTAGAAASSIAAIPKASLTINQNATHTARATPAPAAVSTKRHVSGDNSSWWLGGLVALFAILASVWLLQRRKNNNPSGWDDDEDAASIHAPLPNSSIRQPAEALEEHSMFRHSQLFYGGIEVQEEDGSATLERAQLLIAQGETDQAIELLYLTIEENETETEPWLLLFRVLRQQGMKTEYAQLARRFHDLGGNEDDWALVRNIGYRLDPDNPLYSASHDEIALTPTVTQIKEIPVDEQDLDIILPQALPEEIVEMEPPAPQPVLMDFLAQPETTDRFNHSADNTPPQSFVLNLPPLEFTPEEEESSPLDLALQEEKEQEEIEASVPAEDADDFEEIDLVELDIELQPPLSVFEPRKH